MAITSQQPFFRTCYGPAFAQAFEQALLLASEADLLKVGTVSVDGTKVDANAAKVKSIRCAGQADKPDRSRQFRDAQAVVDAESSMLVLATDVLSTTNDRAALSTLLDQMAHGGGLPRTLLADAAMRARL
ncbi:MAG: transposase [Paracoccus sp. (in: a-proteobacteria)]